MTSFFSPAGAMRPGRLGHVAAALLALLLRCSTGAAQEELACGASLARQLAPGTVDTYALDLSSESVVVVNVADRSERPGLIRLRAPGGLDTCTGSISLAASPGTRIEVSHCIGDETVDYTISANVVSGGTANCARTMPCGLVPYVRTLSLAGEVDAYGFQATRNRDVILRSSDLAGDARTMNIRVFDPEGNPINGQGSCSGEVRFRPSYSGYYTALLTACVETRRGPYQLAFSGALCPVGPEISYLGIARADGSPIAASDYDDDGRPIYTRVGGAGFTVVIEAAPGDNTLPVGVVGYDYEAGDPNIVPDLQVLLSRPLGNGNPAVCAEDPGLRDGVPATTPLFFAATQQVADAINDFGCRVNDGTGRALGITDAGDACTIFADGAGHFVVPDSKIQFCAQIPGSRPFPAGDTIVAVRVRDSGGSVGAAREMIIRVESVPPTPTPTPTPSATASSTIPLPSATPTLGACAGDCNNDGHLTFDELRQALVVTLQSTPTTCRAVDSDGDGFIAIEELVLAVRAGAQSCGAP